MKRPLILLQLSSHNRSLCLLGSHTRSDNETYKKLSESTEMNNNGTAHPILNTIWPLQNLCAVVHAQVHLLETSLKCIRPHIFSKHLKWAWKDRLNRTSMLATQILQGEVISKMGNAINLKIQMSRTRIISWTP